MSVRYLLILMLVLIATPAFALQPQDTLRDWSAAPGADRERLLQQLEKSSEVGAPRKDVLSCLNNAAGMNAHADLAIGDVFRACAKQASEDSI